MRHVRLKKIILLSMLMFIFFNIAACTSSEFVVSKNDTDVISGIESFINRGSTNGIQISIKNQYDFDNKKIVSFITNKGLIGTAELLVMNDGTRLKIGGTGYGTNIINCRLYKTNKAKYLVLTCGKYKQKIQFIKAEYEGKKYIFDVNGEPYYIGSYIVPDNSQEDYCTNCKYYDENNKEIINKIELDVKF